MPDPTVTFWPTGTAPPAAAWQPGDFLLIRNDQPWNSRNGFVSAAIRLGEYWRYRRAGVPKTDAKCLARWNHAVGVGAGCLVEALGAGVVRTPYAKYKGADFLYVQTDLSGELRADAAGFLDLMVGTRYGYWTITAIAARAITGGTVGWVAARSVICSGLVAAMLGAWCWRAWPSWVMPSDLAAFHGISTTRLLDP